ncbi:MAG: EAL domain-containing protein [Burkholderiales bacterium]
MAHATPPHSHLRVLIVDDDVVARRLAVGILRSCGIDHTIEAADGFKALTYLRQSIEPIDLVISDLEMDGMDGIQFLAELADQCPNAAIVLVSAMHRSVLAAVEELARNTGLRVLGAIEKPLERERMHALLEGLKSGQPIQAPEEILESFSHEEIHDALTDHQIVLFYQPKVDLRDGRLIGAEALARWRHPRRGIIPPMSFIPAAEKSGLINELTWKMLESGLRTAADWGNAGLDISVSINITVGFLEEFAVTENIIALTSRLNVLPDRIVLELTESMNATDIVPVIGNLARLRMRGFGLAIDDFGTGYANMQQLSLIPFNELKVDQSFIKGAVSQPDVRAILESSLELGRRLRLQTTAEGIETVDELAMLRTIGCDTAQGFLIAQPMEESAFCAWANEWNRSGQRAMRQMVASETH